MSSDGSLPLPVVDGCDLEPEVRSALRPDEVLPDREGRLRRLPRIFYEVPSWEAATEIYVVPHFSLAELMRVDVREAAAVRDFPRYVPCAVTALAVHLEHFRAAIDQPVHVAANGGYRSPGHALARHASTHSWGAAANIYRIGDEYLDSREAIEKFGALAREHLPGIWTRPWGRGRGFADDHLHLDLGYLTLVPRDAPGLAAAGGEERAEARRGADTREE